MRAVTVRSYLWTVLNFGLAYLSSLFLLNAYIALLT